MATTKPRIQVTLERDVYDAIRDYSELTGTSMSKFVASSMAQAAPALASLNKVLSMAADLSDSAKAAYMEDLIKAECSAADSMGLIAKAGERDNALRVAPAAERTASPTDLASPLAINKGVRSNRSKSNNSKKGSNNIYLASNSENKGKGVQK